MRTLLLTLGHVSLAVGVLGIFLPLLPTTPLVLLASIFYSKASPRFQRWLHQHRRLGPLVSAWNSDGVIRLPAKIIATLMIAGSLAFPLALTAIDWPVKLTAALAGAGCLSFIWSRPSRVAVANKLSGAPAAR